MGAETLFPEMDRPVLTVKKLENGNLLLAVECPPGTPEGAIELEEETAFRLLVAIASPGCGGAFLRLPGRFPRAD